jgi:hypothetical protein
MPGQGKKGSEETSPKNGRLSHLILIKAQRIWVKRLSGIASANIPHYGADLKRHSALIVNCLTR